VFPLFGAAYYWYPKWTGRMMSETLGRWNFALLLIGFHLTFWPLHHLGVHGMPRRVYTYVAETGWQRLNVIATIGAFTIGLSVLLFIWNLIRSYRHGEIAGDDPWGGETLEWSTPSPPPPYAWVYPPTAQGASPMWDNPADSPVVVGLATDTREILCTTTLDARPQHRYDMAGRSISPLLLAMITGFGWTVGGIFHPAGLLVAMGLAFVVLVGWFWSSVSHPPPK
jgi:cytochrome c oxidase subunit 1